MSVDTVLLSTSTCWNCGDDWIREGLLRVLGLRPDVRVLWYNRGWGVRGVFANSLEINLPLADMVIMAGTPEWIARNEPLYGHCLKHSVPMALLGVGMSGGYDKERHGRLMHKVAAAGLVEVAIARDGSAASHLTQFGIQNTALCDPGIFHQPAGEGGNLNVVCWRGLGLGDSPDRYELQNNALDQALFTAYEAMEKPKRVTVHDNREVKAAERLFGAGQVFYSSNPADLFQLYSGCRYFVGARIHGFVAALLHGAAGHLIYPSKKAQAVETVIRRLALEGHARVTLLDPETAPEPDLTLKPIGFDVAQERIAGEAAAFRERCLKGKRLAELMGEK